MNTVRRTDVRSQSLDLLRFPLALFVVAVHVFRPFPWLDDNAEVFPVVDWLFRFVNAFIVDQSVPVYFFIAGYVFFLGMDMSIKSYAGKLRRRCHSLLIPYLMWNTLAILYLMKVMLPGMQAVSEFADTQQFHLSLSNFIECYWDSSQGIIPHVNLNDNGIYPIDTPLWFVRDLMIMVLITPAIYALYKFPTPHAITKVILVFFTLVWAVRIPGLGHLSLLLEAFVFFSWGGFLSYHKRDMIVEFRRYSTTSFILYPLLALSILFLTPIWPQAMVYVKSINVIVGLFFFYNIAAWLVTKRHCRASSFLSSASFFIYCGHYIILDPVARRVFSITGTGGDMAVVSACMLTYIIIIGLLLGVYAMMHRYTPRLLRLFTGGRM
jgi:hypothetical protein